MPSVSNLTSLVLGEDSSTSIPTRTQTINGSVRVTAGTNNPNGVEMRVIGNLVPYHTVQLVAGLPPNGFAAAADHSHMEWLNFATGNPQARQAHQEIYTSSLAQNMSSFVSHGGAITALGTAIANEHSIDTTNTVQNPTAPAYVGRIKVRYTSNPSITSGTYYLFQVTQVQVAGIQAATYTAVAATNSTLVSGLYEAEIDVEGLDSIHWNWANRANESALNDNWSLASLITPLSATQIAPCGVSGDPALIDITLSSVPASVVVGKAISVLIKSAGNVTGFTTGFLTTGSIVSISGSVVRARIANMRYKLRASIGGSAETDTNKFSVFLGARDVFHDPDQAHVHGVQYRDTDGVVTCQGFGSVDFGGSVTNSIGVGRMLMVKNSNEWVAGTDDTTNRMSLTGNVLTTSSGYNIGSVQIRSGSGTPEGAVTAPVGSLFLRTNGGAGTTLYVKESGTGNTGWVGIGAPA